MTESTPGAAARSARQWSAAAVTALGLAWSTVAAGADNAFEQFFGRFTGQAISSNEDELSPRDLEVEIGAAKNGFYVEWTVVIYKASGKVKRSEIRINFARSGRERVYRSAMRTNMFGQQVPMDPLKGDPYFWATIADQTLSVRGLVINEAGGYELQEYHRTLSNDGMDLRFVRVRDGERLKTVTGSLVREP